MVRRGNCLGWKNVFEHDRIDTWKQTEFNLSRVGHALIHLETFQYKASILPSRFNADDLRARKSIRLISTCVRRAPII